MDPTWGKWISVNRAHAREKVPVPYYAASSSICLPASLVFPTMLCRAVLTCSGLAPLPETGCPEYEEPNSPFLTDAAPPYQGAVYRYRHVPVKIAEIVMDKLNAHPVDPAMLG